MKKSYEKPESKIISYLTTEDVIADGSTGGNVDGGERDEWDD